MTLCPREKCLHYNEATKYLRKCYYEPQCWKGYIDCMIQIVKFRVREGLK